MGRSRKKRSKELPKKELQKKEAPEKELQKNESQNQAVPKKESRKKEQGSTLSDREIRRYILFLILPFCILVLITAAMIFGKFLREKEAEQTAASETQPVTAEYIPVIEPDTRQYFQDFGGSILDLDAVPEINQMMESYFRSISECDMEVFLHLFTSQDTSEEETFRTRFEQQKQYIEEYRSISCYTAKGLKEDEYAVYVSYDVKFKDVETPAPDLVRVYAVKGEDGQYRIFDEASSPELDDYLNQLSANEDVRLLISQTDRQAEEAVEADEELKQRIAFLKNGPEYMNEEPAE